MTNQEFISKIAPLVKAENEKRGKPLFCSVVIAQACLETAYGKSEIMMKANAIFGIKAFESWKGKTYSARTREVYENNPVYINDTFRAYDSIEESISDYFDLICKSQRYRKALTTETPFECITAIKEGGYATDPKYVQLVMNIIKSYSLEMYDSRETQNHYKVGQNYVLQVNLNVRDGAGVYFNKLPKNKLTKNAQLHSNVFGTLKKGTIVTCQETKIVDGDIWISTPSGWIARILYGGSICYINIIFLLFNVIGFFQIL